MKTNRPRRWDLMSWEEKWCVSLRWEVMLVVWLERMVGRGRREKRPGLTKPASDRRRDG